MHIGLLGYGKMGQIIARIARERGHEVSAIVDPRHPDATHTNFTEEVEADVFIEFSTPGTVLENIEKACAYTKNIVVGTTGWNEALPEVQQQVKDSGIGFLWGSNFSPAVNAFFHVLRSAAKIANKLTDCDIALLEKHHKHKKDAPSGTAVTAAEILLEEIDRKTELLLDRPEEAIKPNQLHVATVRAGEIPGTHEAIFDFPAETLSVSSVSRSREGFALGAVLAAEWLEGKQGFWEFPEVFQAMIKD